MRSHKIVERDGKTYRLNDFKSLTKDEIDSLVTLCEQKLAEYLQRRRKVCDSWEGVLLIYGRGYAKTLYNLVN